MLYDTKLHEIERGQLNFFQKQTFYRGDRVIYEVGEENRVVCHENWQLFTFSELITNMHLPTDYSMKVYLAIFYFS